MQGTLVFQPLLSPQVTVPTALFSASLAQTPSAYTVSAINLHCQGSEPRIVLSFTPYAVGTTHPCNQAFITPRNLSVPQPVSPGLSPHVRSRISHHFTCGYVTYPNRRFQSRLLLTCRAGDLGGHACRVWRDLSENQDRAIRANPNGQWTAILAYTHTV